MVGGKKCCVVSFLRVNLCFISSGQFLLFRDMVPERSRVENVRRKIGGETKFIIFVVTVGLVVGEESCEGSFFVSGFLFQSPLANF